MKKSDLDAAKEGIEVINSYNGEKRRLFLNRSIFLPIGLVMQAAPVIIEHVAPHYEIIIPIGPDHHATLYISEKAALALATRYPKPVVF